ncbi:MAG: MerR family transcriptional regulator [Caldilinea sp. CFX5]|nr:MerR family transcriptional regulator [Caldilinea sp. CFX5]
MAQIGLAATESRKSVSNDIRLQAYPVTPLYNIKAVEQSTGISSSTLRAWERRYQVCRPQRSDSGYRLYSDRDIAIIRWLKVQVDAGMSISQAVAWLDKLTADAGALEQVALPTNGEMVHMPLPPVTHHLMRRDYAVLQKELLYELLNFHEDGADHVLAEAFALYPIELVGENVIAPVLVEIGDRWHRGELSVTREHFATAILQQRLAAILHTAPHPNHKNLIWVVCAPGEEHEIGALLLTIYLRRAGYQTQYLGKNIKAADLINDANQYQPAMILLSATTKESAANLQTLTKAFAQLPAVRPIIGYGGRIFKHHPELRNEIAGIYMGDSAYEAIESTAELLGGPLTSRTKASSAAPSNSLLADQNREQPPVFGDRDDDDLFDQSAFDPDKLDTE